ncbi:MAG: hypothetical protein CMI36_03440 [Owenweeksia sp.]|nr:hypothetical protein [Owenweeksia sp.]MBF98023.1 hypothetical protein [Owenweeksia sp.]HBF18443.1 hypothetical protein [Cryomorphaceae bacterium]
MKGIISALSFFILLITFTFSCKHDPFPAPPDGMNGDTIKTPVDTTGPNGKPCDPDSVYYSRDIQPLLNANCAYAGCHDAATSQDGVNLSNYNTVIATADVRPFNPGGSDIYEVITDSDPQDRMPQGLPALPADQIALIRKWIEQGALNLSCNECDTTNLTYTNGIKAIFDQNCISCHGTTTPQAGRSLTNYQQVQDAVLNTNLLERINGDPGVPVMPQGGKMPQCNIDKIEIWVSNGLPQ